MKLKRVKRPTDNRMSKGRRLSYEVQPKLQNYMFPEIPERPVVLAELFASVFGQRTAAGRGGEAAASAPPASRASEGAAGDIRRAAAVSESQAARQRASAVRGAAPSVPEVELDMPVGSLFG